MPPLSMILTTNSVVLYTDMTETARDAKRSSMYYTMKIHHHHGLDSSMATSGPGNREVYHLRQHFLPGQPVRYHLRGSRGTKYSTKFPIPLIST
jgi:hypothetical protein